MQITTDGIDKMSDITGSNIKDKINTIRTKKNKNMKFISLLVVSAVALAGIYLMTNSEKNAVSVPEQKVQSNEDNSSAQQQVVNKGVLSNLFGNKSEANTKVEFEPNETELTKKHNALESIKSAGNFKIDANLSDSAIAKHLSMVSFEKGNDFLSLAALAEGYRKNPYSDNKGIATGLGYNASMQTKKTNRLIFSMITKDDAVISSAVNLTGVMSMQEANANDIKRIKIAPQQAAQITQMMSYEFREPMPQIIGEHAKLTSAKARKEMQEKSLTPSAYGKMLLDELKPNERDSMIYHVYKVGAGGFSKYKGLMSAVIDYRYNNTTAQADKVASHFTYKYTINGVVKEDTRASGLITNMFLDREAFGYMVGKTKTYPDSLKSRIQKIHPSVIDKNSGEGQMITTDEYGSYLEQLAQKGITIDKLKIEQRLGAKDLAPYTGNKPRGMGSFFGGTF